MRCTYCRQELPPDAFSPVGDHVVPASLGGGWVDWRVCRQCNERANQVADEWISKDFLTRFLRARYSVRDRYGKAPEPPVVALRLNRGGVVRATLRDSGPTFDVAAPRDVIDALNLSSPADQGPLRRVFAEALGDPDAAEHEALELAQAAQASATPPAAWSRFMAKVGLAAGREAYGDGWLDSRQATILSTDLLGDDPPQLGQRTHHPPVSPSWPYTPPDHQIWIEPHADTAVLMVSLFGQVLGGVPLGDSSAHRDPSAWSLDPHARRVHRTTYPAVWFAHAALRVLEAGGTPFVVGSDAPFMYVPDGPDGPVELGVPFERVESPAHAFGVAHGPKDRESDPGDHPQD
ncbi:HNH endonuclease [Svornostia abyssi]|uniref:HNH endonuclease n=1 Tax=Svornostia abyssi TaxID=2898438 RepID=A0ABY5PB85_9ACTN|nr:HNH endonuclease [Parviterribacteraceae bacterium J379]